jgi:predicted Holliday junction resolvase-like endonuclease
MERNQRDTFMSQLDDWQHSEAQSQLNFNYAVHSAKLSSEIDKLAATLEWQTNNAMEEARHLVASTNNEMEWLAQTSAQQRDFQLTELIQAADHRAQMRVYEASERTYSENTRLIAQAAKQAYSFEKDRLKLERAGIKIQNQETRTRFQGESRDARNQAKQVETRYRSELRQSGLSGEALQKAVKQKMQEFTGKQDQMRREASSKSAEVAAAGKTGGTAERLMRDPYNQADVAIGAMGVELGFFGSEQQTELLKLAEATGLAGQMADLDRQRIYNNLDTSARLTNLTLESLNLQERQAIFQSNNQIDDIKLQARSQMNEARSNRELRPMTPINIPDPTPIAKTLVPQPFMQPRPLQLTPGLQPFLPGKPMAAPMPRMGSAIPRMSSGAGGILANSIFQGAANFASAFQNYSPKPASSSSSNAND